MPHPTLPLPHAMTTSAPSSDDSLVLYGQRFDSRLLLGTSRYPSPAVLEAAVPVSYTHLTLPTTPYV